MWGLFLDGGLQLGNLSSFLPLICTVSPYCRAWLFAPTGIKPKGRPLAVYTIGRGLVFETVRPDKSISSQSAVTLNSLVLVPVSCNPSILSFHTFYITLSFTGSVLVASGAIHSTKVS